MSAKNVQLSVAVHIMTILSHHVNDEIVSEKLSDSIKAEPSFVRKVLAKLSKAGLVTSLRGRNGRIKIAKPASQISLLDIYKATEVPEVFAVHAYAEEKTCGVSCAHKKSMNMILKKAQLAFETSLKKTLLSEIEKQV